MNLIKKIFNNFDFKKISINKLLLVLILHFIFENLLNLPYVNLLRILTGYSVFIFDYIIIIILFRPRKEIFLKSGLVLLGLGIFVALFKLNSIIEIIGNASYLLILTYILFSLRDIRD